MNPTLSVITINRNNAEGLRKTIHSVVTQPCDDYEYIIIDGSSADGSVDVIEEYAGHPEYGRKIVYWVSEPDSGIYNAMNKGIKKAKGSLIALMNSGDSFLPNIFSTIIKIHEQYPNSILYGAMKKWYNGEFCGVLAEPVKYLEKNMIPHATTFVPLSIYFKYGYYDESFAIAGDYDAFLRFYVNKVSFRFIDIIVSNFELGGISMTNKLIGFEVESIHKKYGFYTPPSMQKRITKLIKKILHW